MAKKSMKENRRFQASLRRKGALKRFVGHILFAAAVAGGVIYGPVVAEKVTSYFTEPQATALTLPGETGE